MFNWSEGFAGEQRRLDAQQEEARRKMEANKWLEWSGGPCPVEDDLLVDVKWPDGWGFDTLPAERIDWFEDAPFKWRKSNV